MTIRAFYFLKMTYTHSNVPYFSVRTVVRTSPRLVVTVRGLDTASTDGGWVNWVCHDLSRPPRHRRPVLATRYVRQPSPTPGVAGRPSRVDGRQCPPSAPPHRCRRHTCRRNAISHAFLTEVLYLFTVCRFICVRVYLCFSLVSYCIVVVSLWAWWGGPDGIEA